MSRVYMHLCNIFKSRLEICCMYATFIVLYS
nr:MAG TPA: ribonuclease [Caudoviricetes sp.]